MRSVDLDVERVLKGQAPYTLTYADITLGPPIGDWAQAVIAFSDASTIDFRAPTIAWHIAPDGRVDPEGYQPAADLPPTLDAMVAYFGAPGVWTGSVVHAARGPDLDHVADPGPCPARCRSVPCRHGQTPQTPDGPTR